MASKVEVLVKQAIKTFQKSTKTNTLDKLNANLVQLQKLVDDILLKDINIPQYLLGNSEGVGTFGSLCANHSTNAVEYFEVYENKDVTIGVFILKDGAKLPLHDHPSMFGILKVLQGVIKISSYSVIGLDSETQFSLKNNYYYKSPLNVVKHQDVEINESEKSCLLTPDERNIHEIICVNGPASFLDVLAPPYEEDDTSHPRSCHYFEEIDRRKDGDQEIIKLVQIPCPQNYFLECNSETQQS